MHETQTGNGFHELTMYSQTIHNSISLCQCFFFFFFHIEPHWIISKILYQAHSWRTHSLYGSPSPMGPCATALPYLSIFMLMLSSFNPITASALLLCLAHKRHWPYFFPLFCSFSFSALYLFPSFDPSVSLFWLESPLSPGVQQEHQEM